MIRALPMWAKLSVSGVAVAGTVAGGLAAAGAATSIPAGTIHGCVTGTTRTLERVYLSNTKGTTCPRGSFQAVFAGEGQFHSAESAISQNANGIATNKTDIASNTSAISALSSKVGNVGVSKSTQLTPGTIPTGGGFNAGAADVGTLTLDQGTYLVDVSAKATPDQTTTAQVFPQFFVYNQVKNQNFTGDEFNAGAGALEPFNVDVAHSHDSYYSGSGIVTVPAGGETLHVYAFGYDSDTGAATYALDSGVIAAVRLQG